MKPTLHISLLAFVLAAASHADYTGGRISGQEDPSAGTPLYTGDIKIEYSEDLGNKISGAIEFEGSADSGKSVTVEGNIHLKAGEAYKDDTENTNRNSGLWIGYSDEIGSVPGAADYDNISGSSITLKTAGADDQIIIDVYGNISRGVAMECFGATAELSTITLDSSSSGKDIVINSYNKGSGNGINSMGRASVNVIGNLVLNVATGTAINSYGGTVEEALPATGADQVRVTGTTTITMQGTGSYGIRALRGASASYLDKVTVTMGNSGEATVNSYGVYATTGGGIRMMNGLEVSSSAKGYGIYAKDDLSAPGSMENNISVSGATSVTMSADSAVAIRSVTGGKMTFDGDASIKLSGASTRGISIDGGSRASFTGDVSIEALGTDSYGILNVESSLEVGGKVNIRASKIGIQNRGSGNVLALRDVDIFISDDSANGYTTGILTNSSGEVQLSGSTVVKNVGTGSAARALRADSGGVIRSANGAASHFELVGMVYATGTGSMIDLAMNAGSSFTGSVQLGTADAVVNLALEGASQWRVTGNSAMTELSLDGTSWLSFNMLDAGSMTFANITAASIALADGAVLQLMGVSSADFEGTARALNTFTANLLNAGTLTADGVKLVTEDNYVLDYTNNNDGTFTVTGLTNEQLFIPEPATATLGLLGLASLMVRRRRR